MTPSCEHYSRCFSENVVQRRDMHGLLSWRCPNHLENTTEVANEEPHATLSDRQHITMKLAEIERIARAMVQLDGRSQLVKPDHVQEKILSMLTHVRAELLILSEIVR